MLHIAHLVGNNNLSDQISRGSTKFDRQINIIFGNQ